MRVWVVLDQTEWTRDIVGVFASRSAAIQAIDRTTSWEFTVEAWDVEDTDDVVAGRRTSGQRDARS